MRTFAVLFLFLSFGLSGQKLTSFKVILIDEGSNKPILKIDSMIIGNDRTVYKKYDLSVEKNTTQFQIKGIEAGNYDVMICAKGYENLIKNFKIKNSSGLSYIEKLSSNNDSAIFVRVCPILPEFPGGVKALWDFIDLNWKTDSLDLNISDEYLPIRFIIDSSGNCLDPRTIHKIKSPILQKRIDDLFSKMPKWSPGRYNDGSYFGDVEYVIKLKL